jgi:endonuclease/exonuclease/phosphatase family metal-dependent hydrolase
VAEPRRGLLRVATLNLWGRFGDWPRRLETLRATWPAVDADVLLLQEVWTSPARDQVAQTAAALGYPHAVRGLAVPEAPGGRDVETVAILSRLPLRDAAVTVLPHSDPLRSRVAATVEHPRSALRAACGHTVFTPPALCHAQVGALVDLQGSPAVVGGDLNAPDDVVLPLAARHGLVDSLTGDVVPTWPVDREAFRRGWIERVGAEPTFSLTPRRLDYVLCRGALAVAAGVDPLCDPRTGVPASDHAAVWADLRLP